MIQNIYIIWLRELKRFFRAKSRIIGSLGMPFFFLAILGAGFSRAFAFPGMEGNYLQFLTPGILGMVLLFGSLFTGLSVIWDKQFGFMKEMLVAPVSRISIVLGKTFGGTTTAIFQALLMLLIAIPLGVRYSSFAGVILSIALMVLISASFVSMGIMFASRMEDPHGFQLIMNFLVMPMFLLSGALFPLQGLPLWLQGVSYLNPLTYGVDGLRGLLIGVSHFSIIIDFSILFLFCAGMILLGSFSFRKTSI